MEDFKVLFCFS